MAESENSINTNISSNSSNSNNTSSCEEYVADDVLHIFVLCLAFIGMVANCLLVKEHVTKKNLRINFCFLIALLGLIDSVYLFFLIIADSYYLTNDCYYKKAFYHLVIFLSEWTFSSGIITIILISIDRYLCLSLRYDYQIEGYSESDRNRGIIVS